jgi:outer membrane lipoprotein-sorting protein
MVFSLFACVKKIPSPTIPIISSPQIIVQSLADRNRQVQDLKGVVLVSFTYPQKKFSTKQAIILKKPYYLRLETLGFWGSSLLNIFSNGKQISLYNPQENTLYQGSLQLENIYRLIGIPLKMREIVGILCGEVPLSTDSSNLKLTFDAENNLYLLRTSAYEQIEIGASDLLPRRYYRSRNGEPNHQVSLELSYQDYREKDNILFPSVIQVRFPQTGISIRLKYRGLELNQEVSSTLFQLPRLEGVKVIDLDSVESYEQGKE